MDASVVCVSVAVTCETGFSVAGGADAVTIVVVGDNVVAVVELVLALSCCCSLSMCACITSISLSISKRNALISVRLFMTPLTNNNNN